jgi:hypothetical protein
VLNGYHSNAPILQKIAFLLWLYFQHFTILLLWFWNVAFDVDHALRAPSKYSRPLQIGLGYVLRTVGVAGYICVSFQIRPYGVCTHV